MRVASPPNSVRAPMETWVPTLKPWWTTGRLRPSQATGIPVSATLALRRCDPRAQGARTRCPLGTQHRARHS